MGSTDKAIILLRKFRIAENVRRSEVSLLLPSLPQDRNKITKSDFTLENFAPLLSTHLFMDDSKYEQILCFPAFISDEKIITYANLYVNSVWPWGSWHAANGAVDGGSLVIVSSLILQIEETQTSGQMGIIKDLGPSLSLL